MESMLSRLQALARTGVIPVWIFWAFLGAALAIAGVTAPGLVYHGDIAGYAEVGDGINWRMIWESLWPSDTYYSDDTGAPIVGFDRQLRPWPAVAFLELTGAGSATLWASILLYAVAGSTLLLAVARLDLPRVLSVVALTVVTLLLASSPVVLFQLLAASEGLTISLSLGALAASIALASGATRTGWWITLITTGAVSAIIRPQLMIIWVPLWASLMWLHRRQGRRFTGRVLAALVVAVAGVAIWTFAYASAWEGGTSRATVLALYTTNSGFSPAAERIRQDARAQLEAPPQCFPVTSDERPDPMPVCANEQDRNAWAGQFASWYLRYLVTNPRVALSLARDIVPVATTLTVASPGVSVIPLPIQQLLVGSYSETPNSGGEPTKFNGAGSRAWLDPIWIGLPILLIVLLILLRQRHSQPDARSLGLVTVMTLTAATSLVVIILTVITLPSTRLEMNRIAIAPNVMMRVAVVVGIACGVGSLLRSYRARRVRMEKVARKTGGKEARWPQD